MWLQPAGHVLGSAQVAMEWRGSRAVVSGDYKRQPDPTCLPFVPIPCDVFVLRYLTDEPNDKRRFQLWVSTAQHYVVKKTVWDGGDHEHETIVYRDPLQVLPGIWVPTEVDAYDPAGELGGTAAQRNLKAS